MTSVTVDAAQTEVMLASGELVQVRNAAGEVIGFFAPNKIEHAEEYAKMAARSYSLWGEERPPERSMTTEEVVAWLQKLKDRQ